MMRHGVELGRLEIRISPQGLSVQRNGSAGYIVTHAAMHVCCRVVSFSVPEAEAFPRRRRICAQGATPPQGTN